MTKRASREYRSALVNWGNWHILLSDHEFGWPDADSVLAIHADQHLGSHRVLIDMPARVREVDLSVAQAIEDLQNVLKLTYCWDRDKRGYPVSDFRRAQALGVSIVSYDGLLALAERVTEPIWDELRRAVKRQQPVLTSA